MLGTIDVSLSEFVKYNMVWIYEFYDWSSQLYTQLKQLWIFSPKKLGLNGIRTHDLWDTGAVLYQLSYQANWSMGAGHIVSSQAKLCV